jgi:hypothetical protein
VMNERMRTALCIISSWSRLRSVLSLCLFAASKKAGRIRVAKICSFDLSTCLTGHLS